MAESKPSSPLSDGAADDAGNSASLRESPGNPSTNRLPKGTTAKQVLDAVHSSGYPVQSRAAILLSDTFSVTEEWGYLGRDSTNRNLDLYAARLQRQTEEMSCIQVLLVECKRHKFPSVFFPVHARPMGHQFPILLPRNMSHVTLKDGTGYHTNVPMQVALRVREHPFVDPGPPICAAYTMVEHKPERDGIKVVQLSGEMFYKGLVYPLVEAAQRMADITTSPDKKSWPTMLCMVGVVDGPMILMDGANESSSGTMCPWVRLVRHEPRTSAGKFTDAYYIDVVHIDYLTEYIAAHNAFAAWWMSCCKDSPKAFGGTLVVNDARRWKHEDFQGDSDQAHSSKRKK